MRTFVFISDIPEHLLQPLPTRPQDDSSSQQPLPPGKAARDPRYERLRRLLAEHTSGVMLVMHLETRGYGLALYTSEAEALAACRTRIVPPSPAATSLRSAHNNNNNNNNSDGNDEDAAATAACTPLRLRIVEREQPPPPEAVYTPTLHIEGECVAKSTLATTRGLELVYRGKAVARWCPHTRAGADCPLGTSCFRVHKQAYQRTAQKRPRSLDSEEAAVRAMLADGAARQQLQALLQCRKAYEETLLTTTTTTRTTAAAVGTDNNNDDALRLQPCMYVLVTLAEVQALFAEHDARRSGSGTKGGSDDTMRTRLAQRVHAHEQQQQQQQQQPSLLQSRSFFVRLSCPGGAPYDWSLYDDDDDDEEATVAHDERSECSGGTARLRRCCPPPPRGTPTPLERDVYIQRLHYACNRLNRFATVTQALHALSCSARVRRAVDAHAEDTRKRRRVVVAAAADKDEDDGDGVSDATSSSLCTSPQLYLCVHPWLYLPTVGCEVSVFVERSGARLRAVVQRYGELRCMLPVSLLPPPPSVQHTAPSADTSNNNNSNSDSKDTTATVATSRFALLGNNVDADAEAALSRELQQHSRAFMYAARSLCSLLQHHTSRTHAAVLPAGASLCARLALVLPTHATTQTTAGSSSSSSPRVVVLSLSSYERALESCALYSSMTHRHLADVSGSTTRSGIADDDDRSDASMPVAQEVTWNVYKHQHVPLIATDVLERLQRV